jgi:hypothetical protein
MLSLCAPSTFLRVAPTRPPATHCAIIAWSRRVAGGTVRSCTLGNITLDMSSQHEVQRLERIVCRLKLALGPYVQYHTTTLAAWRERNSLSDLERMRRKWARIMRAYESDKQDILQGRTGFFTQDRLAELDQQLQRARCKVEATYGHPITALDDQHLAQRAQYLDAQGLLDHVDYTHLR